MRTLTKLSVFGPAEVLLANNGSSQAQGQSNSDIKAVLDTIKAGGGPSQPPQPSQGAPLFEFAWTKNVQFVHAVGYNQYVFSR